MPNGVAEEFAASSDQGTQTGRLTAHSDATTTLELKQTLVSQLSQSAVHRVVVDAEHGGEVSGWWQPASWFRLTIGDRSSHFGCHLQVERHGRFVIEDHR